jgi:uncharacterized membrane protein YczE
MCLAIVIALILLPLGGFAIGMNHGPNGGWIGAAIGFALAVVLAGWPTAIYLKAEKTKYDRENPPGDGDA